MAQKGQKQERRSCGEVFVVCGKRVLLISSKTDKETLARCNSISGHGNSSQSSKLYPPSFVSTEVK